MIKKLLSDLHKKLYDFLDLNFFLAKTIFLIFKYLISKFELFLYI